jgi:hypothetical protein
VQLTVVTNCTEDPDGKLLEKKQLMKVKVDPLFPTVAGWSFMKIQELTVIPKDQPPSEAPELRSDERELLQKLQ